jgi:archaellum component FlaD/FlaE
MELSEPNLVSASAPNALDAFMDKFTTLTESYWFYNNTIELRFDVEAHKYFKVDPDLGNLIEQHGVTNTCHIIDRSSALTPWAAKKVAEKMLRIIPLITKEEPVSTLEGVEHVTFPVHYIPEMTLEAFTKLVLEAKTAPKDILIEAGDIGHLAHKCLEDSIQHALDNDPEHIVRELRDLPADEKATHCANAGFDWMQKHNVRWLKTEQKIYSREHEYAGTMDGLAIVDSCTDPSCCATPFKDHRSLIDWKSSNYLYIEYCYQTASYVAAEVEEYGVPIDDRWILRLGKNEEEAGKFEPWYLPGITQAKDFAGFLACLRLTILVDEVTARIQEQKAVVRAAKKKQKAEQKAIDKANVKAQREAEKAQKKLDRAAERERIKQDAKRVREEAKRQGKVSTHDYGTGNSRTSTLERSSGPTLEYIEREGTAAQSNEETSSPSPNQLMVGEIYEKTTIVRRPFVIAEEG